ncbi:MAG TPA: hypothetical protein VGH74_12320 [Planctomycetaceae bacterium]
MSFSLAAGSLPADPLPDAVAEPVEDTQVSEPEFVPDSPALPEPEPIVLRTIGKLAWHVDYSAAYREAREAHKMLFVFFRDESRPRIADLYEHDILSHADTQEALAAVVRVAVPLDTLCPTCNPDEAGQRMLTHDSFKYMYGRQGIAMIDLTIPNSELYAKVVSAHPFTPGRYYTVHGTKTVLGLPQGTVTQRALIYAVRIHPASPVSTTSGKCHGYMCKMANESSKLMAQYGSVGHHDWGNRYGNIAAQTGRSASEVAAGAGNTQLIDAAIQVVDQWYGSPAHWGIMSAPASIFGYDLVRDSAGNWWGTGVFAN